MPDSYLYILFATLFLISLLQTLRLRKVGKMAYQQREQHPERTKCNPEVSIIILCQEQETQLRELLPILLSQQYAAAYEVIVVDMCDKRETSEWLETMEEHYRNLYHTFCPASARDISLQRLALSLGVKAASYDWLVFLPVDAQLLDERWLSHFTAYCNEKTDAVLGIASYAKGGGWYGQKVRFQHLWEQLTFLPIASRHSPFAPTPLPLCYRRNHFLSHQGFADTGLLVVGTEALLVNHNITRGRCRVNLLQEARIQLPLPSPYVWQRNQLFEVETRRHLRRAFFPLLADVCRQITLPIFVILVMFCLARYQSLLFSMEGWDGSLDETMLQLLPLLSLCSLLVACLIQFFMLRNSCRVLGLKHPPLALPFLMLWLPCNGLWNWLRWCFTKKEVFRRKFI